MDSHVGDSSMVSNDDSMDLDHKVEATPSSSLLDCPVEGCGKTFTRADHVRRHISSAHQKALPFLCVVCNKRFGRRDLLKRHETKHGNLDDSTRSRGREHKPRVRHACSTCAAKKLKCDGNEPCSRCKLKDIDCIYPTKDGITNGQDAALKANSTPTGVLSPAKSYMPSMSGVQSGSSTATYPTPPQHVSQNQPDLSSGNTRIVSTLTPQSNTTPLIASGDTNVFEDVLDFGNQYRIDFDAIDFSIFDNIDAEFAPTNELPTSVPDDMPKPPSSMFLVGGFEAFQRSLWFYNPRESRAIDERENLGNLISSAGAGLSTKLGNVTIDQSLRDRLLCIVADSFKMIDSTSARGHIPYFPSDKVLNDLLQFSLAVHYVSIDSWIHSHIFHSEMIRLPLLGSLIAYGAVHSALPAVQKFGYAMQEAIRLRGPSVFEEDSSHQRNLGAWQTFLLLITIGLWSGVGRKIELAECFLTPNLTMLRRGGCFQAENYQNMCIPEALSGPSLQDKWMDFLKQESQKRLVIHGFMHDAQTSMSLQTNVVICLAEMALPLPAPGAIWSAESAESWQKEMLNSSYNSSIQNGPTLAQCIDDVTFLVNARDSIDFPLAALAVVQGIWHMIRPHQEFEALNILAKSPTPSSHSLFLKTRQDGLVGLLKRFHQAVMPLLEDAPRLVISLQGDVLMMYLHIRMAELQLFAGKHGEGPSQDAFKRLQLWIMSSDSRVSIHHAALVLRKATQLRPGSLRDFLAVAVYHASLTLWCYGTIRNASNTANGSVTAASGPIVLLDDADSTLVNDFITLSRGVPCIPFRGFNDNVRTDQLAPIDDPRAVMAACLLVLEGNFGKLADGLKKPTLVENLAKLMRDLGSNAFVMARPPSQRGQP